MSNESIAARLKKHIAKRRAVIVERYRKKLNHDEYMYNCGLDQELTDLEAVLQAAIRKANSAEGDDGAASNDDDD